MTAKELLSHIQLMTNMTNNFEHLEELKKTHIFDDIYESLIEKYRRLPTDYECTYYYEVIKKSFNILKKLWMN